MNPFNVLRSFLVSLTITAYIVIAIVSPSRSSSCPPDQRDALLRLKNSFSITEAPPSDEFDFCVNTSYPKTANWREDRDCCSWEGVMSDNSTGDIIGLDSSCASLRGAIDSNSSLFSLLHLRSLSLSRNDFLSSSIPPEISVFSRMTYLNLSFLNISGNVPTEISQLSKLVSLDLSGNGLEVQNPTMRMLVKNLTQLEDLDLFYVNMSAVIPTSLMNFSSSLISLNLSHCGLGGKFPDYIFQLRNLQQLDLSFNFYLHGTLPESNWSSSLAFLSLADCSFNREVPHSIGTLTRLTYLDLSFNNFNGGFPNSIGNLTRLTSLYLSFNNFNGGFPNSIGTLTRLTSLDLSRNNFNGGVPDSIGNLTRLTSLDLSKNNFNGGVPNSIGNLTRLTSLYLSFNNFNGGFPNSIGTLTRLTFLDLSFNNFSGGVPNSIGTLTRLTYLLLSRNNFTGGVPDSIGNLTRLTSLGLSRNKFNGGVPNSIVALTRLTSLNLSLNNFTGDVDFWIFSTLKNLRSLWLSGLSVSGEDANHKFPKLEILAISLGMVNNFPCVLSGMPELWRLYLSGSIVSEFPGQCVINGLSFPQIQELQMNSCKLTKFPSFLSHSRKLTILFLRGNMIEEIPSWFWGIGIDTLEELDLRDNLIRGGLRLPWKRLYTLILHNNSFEGPLPIPASRSISFFDLSQNRFNGSIPLSICQLTHLQDLKLSQNNLTGVIPQCLSNLTDLRYLDLSSNSLTGPLPLPSYAMNYYSVSNNNFSGEISSLICNAANLQLLDMSNNGLTGTLPQCLKTVTIQLNFLNLRANRFQGSIPEIFHEQSSLMSLDFSRNQFDGSLPRSLSNCKKLEALDVGNNKIVDSFPNWLGDLPLKVLNLRSNKFHGRVSISKGTRPFSSIRILDISNNGFNGSLPDNLITETFGLTRGDGGNAIGYMTSNGGSEYYSVMIIWKGVVMEVVKINVQFATLDLSSNCFCGEIPRNIGLLKSLKSLNFSHNSFMGTIPPSLGNLTNLESLDLSSNHLVGEIPKELVRLTSLGTLDLSWNNLAGPIPSGGQFITFFDSFEGNPGLCGIPLKRVCSQGHAGAQPLPDQRDNGKDEAGGWFEWKFVAMGFGSGVRIGISLGYMALEMGRPLWLARMVFRLEGSCRKRSKRKGPRRNSRL